MKRTTITATDLEANLESILDRVGRGSEYLISDDGHPIAQLSPVAGPTSPRTVADAMEAWSSFPPEPSWAALLEQCTELDAVPDDPSTKQ